MKRETVAIQIVVEYKPVYTKLKKLVDQTNAISKWISNL